MQATTETLGLDVISTVRTYLMENADSLRLQTPNKITHVGIKYTPDWSGLKLTYRWNTNDPNGYFCFTCLQGTDLYDLYTHFKSFQDERLTGFKDYMSILGNIIAGVNIFMQNKYGAYTFIVDYTVNAPIAVPMLLIRD